MKYEIEPNKKMIMITGVSQIIMLTLCILYLNKVEAVYIAAIATITAFFSMLTISLGEIKVLPQ